MTKKHFKRLAILIGSIEMPEDKIEQFIDLFIELNPRFDKERFQEAVAKAREDYGKKVDV